MSQTATRLTIDPATIQRARDDIADTIGRFVKLTRRGSEYVACCPFHDEKSPSFTVKPAKGFYYCFGCGAQGDAIAFVMNYEGRSFPEAITRITGDLPPVTSAVSTTGTGRAPAPAVWRALASVPADAPPPPLNHWRLGSPSRVWEYRAADGSLLGLVCRFEITKPDGTKGKETLPLCWANNTETGECYWRWLSFTAPRPLYGLDRLAARPDAKVLLVEGEKTADAAAAIFPGFVVVAWPGGGKAVGHTDWTPLSGRAVTMWPDWDWQEYKRGDLVGTVMPVAEQPGVVTMAKVYETIKDSAASVRVVPPLPGSPNGWDLADAPPVDGWDASAYARASVLPAGEYFASLAPVAVAAPVDVAPVAANDNQSPARPDRLVLRGEFLQSVEAGGTVDQMETLAHRVRGCEDLAPSDREIIAKAIQQQLRDLHDLRMPIPTIRAWVGLSGPGVSDMVPLKRDELASVPAWAAPWAYRQDTDEMFNMESKTSVSMRGFDFEHNRLLTWEQRDAADMKNASEFCRELWMTPVLDSVIYLPAAPATFLMDGVRYGNSYRPDLVPRGVPAAEWSEDAAAAVALVVGHLERIVPNREEREILTMWLAHNVQRPGDKINWAPIIVGNFGDGKSVVASMLGEVMGKQNVKVIGGDVLVESAFNGWAEGSAVVAIEEVRISGHNRYEVMDKLKPLITNDRVPIHAKHRDPYTVPNVVNYLMFSNHLDAVPLDEKDRRYFVLATPFIGKSRDSITAAGLTADYFTALFNSIRDYHCEIRGWLESVDLSTFRAKGNAPFTSAKQSVVEFCRSDDELAVGDVLADGAVGVTKSLFSSTCVATALEGLQVSVPRTQALNRILQQLGYRQLTHRVFWNGSRHRVWVDETYPTDPTPDQVRAILEKTRFG